MGGQKQGGNVASYFCLSDGSVLHVIPGPVDAPTLLREARWVVETRKLAIAHSQGDIDEYKSVFRRAHSDRLRQEHGVDLRRQSFPEEHSTLAHAGTNNRRRKWSQQGQAHYLLATSPLVKIEQIYDVVFEKILKQKLSTLPVEERPAGS